LSAQKRADSRIEPLEEGLKRVTSRSDRLEEPWRTAAPVAGRVEETLQGAVTPARRLEEALKRPQQGSGPVVSHFEGVGAQSRPRDRIRIGENSMASLPAIDPAAARPPATAQPVYVDAPDALADACARWRGAGVLGIDTEFVRERTFYPGLGLIQVTDGDAVALVDPVALGDLCPLERVFADEGIVKVLHSCSEDMEVFFHRFGALPRPVFDTQVAAAFLGLGYSPGYSALVEALFGVEVPKHLTRTNWLRRPLSADQKRYAALDVAHLLPCYDVLSEGLRRCGRDAWAAEEFAQLVDAGRFDVDLALRR
jgi:hypothetical protein